VGAAAHPKKLAEALRTLLNNATRRMQQKLPKSARKLGLHGGDPAPGKREKKKKKKTKKKKKKKKKTKGVGGGNLEDPKTQSIPGRKTRQIGTGWMRGAKGTLRDAAPVRHSPCRRAGLRLAIDDKIGRGAFRKAGTRSLMNLEQFERKR